MKKPFAIFLAVGLTAVFSPQLMTALQHAVLAHGQQLIVTSPTESFSVTVWFVLGTCMCVALAAGTGFYLRRRAPLVRSTCVLLPVLIAAAVATILKVTQLDSAASAAMTLGFDSVIQLKQAGIHTIPWVGFAAGVSVSGSRFSSLARQLVLRKTLPWHPENQRLGRLDHPRRSLMILKGPASGRTE